MKSFLSFLLLFFSLFAFSQISELLPSEKELLKTSSNQACLCIDSININNKTSLQVSADISNCIEKQATAYQMTIKILKSQKEVEKTGNKKVNIEVNTNQNSNEFKKYYYELERELRSNCVSLNDKINSNEKKSHHSVSENDKALDFYNLGIKENESKNHKKALEYFQKAVKEDHDFPFAWDNIGFTNRALGNYDDALKAYQTSLQIDPTGKMPLQNIPIVYIYKKDYQKAVDAYLDLKKTYLDDPEVDYGIGVIYYDHLKDNQKALDYMCKAYNKYTEMKSPYRTDAESIIRNIYQIMSKEGKKDDFLKILKNNNINFE